MLKKSIEISNNINTTNYNMAREIVDIARVTMVRVLCGLASEVLNRHLQGKTSPEASTELLLRAESICKDLKKTSPGSDQHKDARQNIEIVMLQQSKLKVVNDSKLSQPVKDLKLKRMNQDVFGTMKEAKFENFALVFEELRMGAKEDQAWTAPQRVEWVLAIEAHLAGSPEVTDPSDLKQIYGVAHRILKDPNLLESHLLLASQIFVNGNELESALARVEALAALTQGDPVQHLRVLLAHSYIRNLMGFPEAWLALEQQIVATDQRTAQKNAEKRRRQKEKLRADVAAARQVEALEDEQRQLQRQSQVVGTLPAPAPDSGKVWDGELPSPEESRLAAQARLERHQANEAARSAKAAATQAPSSAAAHPGTQEPTAAAPERPNPADADPRRIADLYDLPTLPRRVDQEIEARNWTFTRDELQSYLEALGCTYVTTIGNHRKIKLPQTTQVQDAQGRVVAVFVAGSGLQEAVGHVGGAMTLPAWTDQVPPYLRKQILAAREAIRRARLLA